MSWMLAMLIFAGGGSSTDLASLIPPQEYFKTKGIETGFDKMITLASAEPKEAKTHFAQLMALRYIAESSAKFKAGEGYAAQRKVLEEIAAGKTAQDRLGFAKEYAQAVLHALDGTAPKMTPPAKGLLEDGLAWFPENMKLIGVMDGRLQRGRAQPGKSPVADMFKMMKDREKTEFFSYVEELGNIRIDRVSFAVSEVGNNIQFYVRGTGKADQGWVRDLLKAKGVATKEQKVGKVNVLIIPPDDRGRSPFVALIGETDVLIAGGGNDVLDLALDVRDGKKTSVLKGAEKATIEKLSGKACGLLVGELPGSMRKDMARDLGAMPSKVTAWLERTGKGMDVQLEAALDNEADSKAFVEGVSKMRQKGVEELKNVPDKELPPGITLAPVRNLLESLQIQGKGNTATLRVLVPDEVMNTLPAWFFFAHGAHAGPLPPMKNEDPRDK